MLDHANLEIDTTRWRRSCYCKDIYLACRPSAVFTAVTANMLFGVPSTFYANVYVKIADILANKLDNMLNIDNTRTMISLNVGLSGTRAKEMPTLAYVISRMCVESP